MCVRLCLCGGVCGCSCVWVWLGVGVQFMVQNTMLKHFALLLYNA